MAEGNQTYGGLTGNAAVTLCRKERLGFRKQKVVALIGGLLKKVL